MKWSKMKSLKPGQGRKVRIKTKHGEMGLSDLELQQIGEAVSVSRQILPQVIGMVSWPTQSNRARVYAHMDRYFKTGTTPSQQDVQAILKRLELVMNGINSKIKRQGCA